MRNQFRKTTYLLFALSIALFLLVVELPWSKRSLGISSTVGAQESLSKQVDTHSSPLLSKLRTTAENLSPFERRVEVYDLLVDASADSLTEFIDQAQDLAPVSVQREFQESAVRRLSLIDPPKALNLVNELPEHQKEPLIQSVFEEWSMFDTEKATDHARHLDHPARLWALKGLLAAHNGLSNEEKLSIARNFGEERIFTELAAIAITDERIENPSERWVQLTSKYGSDLKQLTDAQRDALAYVAQALLQAEGVDALTKILSTFSNNENRGWLLHRLLERLNQEDPSVSVELAANVIRTDREVLMQAFGEWSAIDGWSAFTAARRLDEEAKAGSDRLQRAVIIGWAQSNPHTLLSALPQLPISLQNWTRETALLQMSFTFPESVPTYLEDVRDKRQKAMIIDNFVMRWARIDPIAAFEWTSTYADIPSEALGYGGTIFEEAVSRNPHSALHMALSFPLAEGGLGPEAFVISGMTYWDVEKAIDMLEAARNSYTRQYALGGIGLVMVRKGETERLIELVAEESEEDQFKYFERFAWHWVAYDPKDLLTQFDSLPTERVKEQCARVLLLENEYEPFMTAEDMDRVREFVSDEDRDLLQHSVEQKD